MEASIYNFSGWIEKTVPEELISLMQEKLTNAGFKILNLTDHHFQPHGFTAVWLLAESHLAIHTFPEANKTYIEISSCNKVKNQKFVEMLKPYLIDE